MARSLSILALIGLLLTTSQPGRSESGNDLAVIVNKALGAAALSSSELRSIFLGTKDSWPDGSRILVVTLPIERPETQVLLKKICAMSESDFKRYFLMMNFQGKSIAPPRMLSTASAVRSFVRVTPGSLGVLRMRDVDATVTVASIDGRVPDAAGYKLTMGGR